MFTLTRRLLGLSGVEIYPYSSLFWPRIKNKLSASKQSDCFIVGLVCYQGIPHLGRSAIMYSRCAAGYATFPRCVQKIGLELYRCEVLAPGRKIRDRAVTTRRICQGDDGCRVQVSVWGKQFGA